MDVTKEMFDAFMDASGVVGPYNVVAGLAAVLAIADREHRAAAEQLIADLKRITESARSSAEATAPELITQLHARAARASAYARAVEMAEQTLLGGGS